MKKCFCSLILISVVMSFISCSKKNNSVSFDVAKPIVKSVGNMDVIVDPNVELMMILARLADVQNYSKGILEQTDYLDEVDSYFENFAYDKAVVSVRCSNLDYGQIPEYGMYMNEDSSGFKMKLMDKNFILVIGKAKKNFFYRDRKYMQEIRDFRINSKFDEFFMEHKALYEEMIDEKIRDLSDCNFEEWYKEFFGENELKKSCLYVTNLGGNFEFSYRTSTGSVIPHAVILADYKGMNLSPVLSSLFLFSKTNDIMWSLYENEKVVSYISKLFSQDYSYFNEHGTISTYSVFSQLINHALTIKYLETVFAEEDMNSYKSYLTENKLSAAILIAECLDEYNDNRSEFKTIEDFYPELEEYIASLDKE